MFLGTGSDAGKSVIAAGFCRILHGKGYNVAPFKAQNMALNSFVTMDGKEMGRAQVYQAAAAGLLPDVDMNPVLLKPYGNCKTQVILQGKVLVNDTAEGYYRMKEQIFTRVMESYQRLRHRYDTLILEGAGSLTEINLKKSDIVNMEMARAAGAPVIVVADIDRGGVFAALIGTMKLLTPRERKLIIGFIINKFRGSIDLFTDGIKLIEKLTRRPVFGIVPYFDDINLPEEDSVALHSGRKGRRREGADVRIAVISLPLISNYTDFDPLELEKGVSLWYANTPEEILDASVVIIPGTKNTIEDLKWLKEAGFIPVLENLSKGGTSLIGICGGYQMLGNEIRDPYGIESATSRIEGIGFLPIETVLERNKTLTRVSGRCTLDGIQGEQGKGVPIDGYEIHMGKTTVFPGTRRPFIIESKEGTEPEYEEGAVSRDNLVWGTYLHGLFENDLFRERFLIFHGRRGSSGLSYRAYLDAEFDRLAAYIERNVDVEHILKTAERYR